MARIVEPPRLRAASNRSKHMLTNGVKPGPVNSRIRFRRRAGRRRDSPGRAGPRERQPPADDELAANPRTPRPRRRCRGRRSRRGRARRRRRRGPPAGPGNRRTLNRPGGATGASAGGSTSRPPPHARTRPRRLQPARRPVGAEDLDRCPRTPVSPRHPRRHQPARTAPADGTGAAAPGRAGDDQASGRGGGACRPRRAATRSGPRESQPTCRTGGRLSARSRSRRMRRRRRRSSTTGRRTR